MSPSQVALFIENRSFERTLGLSNGKLRGVPRYYQKDLPDLRFFCGKGLRKVVAIVSNPVRRGEDYIGKAVLVGKNVKVVNFFINEATKKQIIDECKTP